MYYTTDQRKALKHTRMCKVLYKDIWTEGELGYSTKGSAYYEIVVAKDVPELVMRRVTLLHELGHVVYNHLDSSSYKEDIELIKSLFDKHNIPFSAIAKFGGPMSFLNICMDFEVNSKLLTLQNVEDLNRALQKVNPDLFIQTPDRYEIDVLDSYRDYFEPLIERINDEDIQQLSQMQQDLAEALSSFQKDLDSEIKKALEQEKYFSGNFKRVDREDTSSGKDPEDALRDEEQGYYKELEQHQSSEDGEGEGDKGEDSSKVYGLSHSTFGEVEIKENSKEVLKKFFTNIIDEGYDVVPNCIRHHNHGTRRNEANLLYTSFKRDHRENNRKLGVVIDVSGSMYTDSIIQALSSLKDSIGSLNSESEVVTWDTNLCTKFPLSEIPDYVSLGGGTDMNGGLKYFIEKGFTDVVIYSDMGTTIQTMIETIRESNCKVYTIYVGGDTSCIDKELEEYFKLNKSFICVKSE